MLRALQHQRVNQEHTPEEGALYTAVLAQLRLRAAIDPGKCPTCIVGCHTLSFVTYFVCRRGRRVVFE